MAKKQDSSGKASRSLPVMFGPSRSSQAWTLTHVIHYLLYLAVSVGFLFMHEMFHWSLIVSGIMAGVWIVLIILMIRIDASKILAAEVTRKELRLRYFWGWQRYPWEQVRGFLFKRPEDDKLVTVRVVPRYADGHLPRYSVLVMADGHRPRLDAKIIMNPKSMLETLEWMLQETAHLRQSAAGRQTKKQ